MSAASKDLPRGTLAPPVLRTLVPLAAIAALFLACLREAPPLLGQPGAGAAPPPPAAPETRDEPIDVAILIFDGVQIIDSMGPYEVFGQAGFRVFTVAAAPGPLSTSMGLRVTPTYTLAEAPRADVLVLPGGDVDGQLADAAVLAWVRQRTAAARHVLSVCNGAFILARAGLLDGLSATTFYDLIPELRERFPRVRVVADRRYVDNGRVITTAGLSSGIDGALHVVELLRGRGRAQQVALNMEYDWKPGSDYARASLADRHLRRLFGRGLRVEVPDGGRSRVLRTEGSASRWEAAWEVESPAPLPELRTALARRLREGGWTPRGPEPAREWRFVDEERRPWTARVELGPAPGGAGPYHMAIAIERAGA